MGQPEEPKNYARAGVRARREPLEVEVVGVRLSKPCRKHRLALVDVRIGPVVVTYSYRRMRLMGRWAVHLPVDCDGEEVLRLPEDLDERIVHMVREAAEADEAIWRGLRQWLLPGRKGASAERY